MVTATVAPTLDPRRRPYRPYGTAEALFYDRTPILGMDGPAGTGKSRACLEKVHLLMEKYAGARALIFRKTRTALTESALVTWENKVVPEGHPMFRPRNQRRVRQRYSYPNGSEVIIGGMDDPERVKSTEYDIAYGQELTECDEDDIEIVTTRLRNGVTPYQQLLFDCNPGPPTHWIKQRELNGGLKLLSSRHEDNPEIWDADTGAWTPRGASYIAVLDALTGHRRDRLRFGRWSAAEGVVYPDWDAAVHLIPRFPIPDAWPRYWTIDFGYTNPFVWSAWARDPDGRLYRYRELYQTQRIVADHARDILALVSDPDAEAPTNLRRRRWHEPKPQAIICDHDAEDRATFERETGLSTIAAWKSVSPGIQAVASRLRPAGDGKPRLFLLRDSLVERDPTRSTGYLPCSGEEEFDAYVWDKSSGRKLGEEPLKKHDHAMDSYRYLIAHVDLRGEPGVRFL